MNHEYTVYYRTGGTQRFAWHRMLDNYTVEDAIRVKSELERAGYRVHYAKAALVDKLGLPDTWE